MSQLRRLLKTHCHKTINLFCDSTFLANLLQSLDNIADMLVVGRIVGSTGVLISNNVFFLVFIVNTICVGMTMGNTVLIAQYQGARNELGQKKTIGIIYAMTAVVTILITCAGISFISKS